MQPMARPQRTPTINHIQHTHHDDSVRQMRAAFIIIIIIIISIAIAVKIGDSGFGVGIPSEENKWYKLN